MSRFPRFRTAGVVGLSAVLIAIPASADNLSIRDRATTGGRLDLATVSHGHKIGKDGDQRLFHRIKMHARWPSDELKGDRKSLVVEFDVHPEDGYSDYRGIADRVVLINFENGKLTAKLRAYRSLNDSRLIARLPVWRPDRYSVVFTVKSRQLRRRELRRYGWGVVGHWEEHGHPECPSRDPCFDFAPDRPVGHVEHRL